MSNDTTNVGQGLQNLFARAVQEQVRLSQNYVDVVQRLGRGDLSTESTRNELYAFARNESGRYARELALLSIDYYTQLFKLNSAYSQRFVEHILGTASRRDDSSSSPVSNQNEETSVQPTRRRIEVTMQAPLGETATRSFTFENKQPDPANISFLISDFVDATGMNSFRPSLQIEPARFTIEPGGEQVVALHLPLSADHFVAGQRYTATAVVHGYDGLELELVALASPAIVEPDIKPVVESETKGTATSGPKKPKRQRQGRRDETNDN